MYSWTEQDATTLAIIFSDNSNVDIATVSQIAFENNIP